MSDYFLPVFLFLITVAGGIVISLWRHKQTGVGPIEVVGLDGRANTQLDPEGSVLVYGELWPARSLDGTSIAVDEHIEVTGVEGHLLIVKRYT